MAFVKNSHTFLLVIFTVLLTGLSITHAKPATLHEHLKFPCGKNAQSEIVGEIDEAELWSHMKKIIVHEINHAVVQIRKHEDHLPCETSPKISVNTLHKLNDFSQFKSLREASHAAYGDLLNLAAHLNVIVDNQECWNDDLTKKFKKLRNTMLPVLCSMNGLLEPESQKPVDDVIALKITSSGKECSHHKTETCTILTHIKKFAKGLQA